MKALKPEKQRLKSSFTAKGRFRVPAEGFGKRLLSLPIPGLRKNGPIYSMVETDGTCNSEIQFEGNKLTFCYSFERSTQKEYAKNLLRFLSILTLANEIYEVELGSIYPSIMEVLAGYVEETPDNTAKIQNTRILINRIKILAEMNCSLSFKALESEGNLQILRDRNENLIKFSKDVIEAALEKTGGKDPAAEILPKILGTAPGLYKSVFPLAFEER